MWAQLQSNLSPSRTFKGCFASKPTAHAHKNQGKGSSQPRGHSPVTPAPVGSSDKVGSVFSQAAQFTSSTLWVTETALKFREACNSQAGFPRGWGGESPPGTKQIMRKIRVFPFSSLP